MDYEKAYKAVLQTAKQWIKDGCADKEKICLECVFPELAESEDERIRRTLVEYFGPQAQLDFVRGIPIQKIRDWLENQKEPENVSASTMAPSCWTKVPEQCLKCNEYEIGYKAGYTHGCTAGYNKAMKEVEENPKSADSIPADCASGAKCGDRWQKVGDSLPDNPREVLCKDEAGNYFIGRYYVGEGWEISNYDDEDKPHHLNPPVSKWIDFPSEKQKEQKPELVQHPPITFAYNSNASRDERLKAALLALLNSDLIKIKEGGYFTKQDLIEWVEQKPAECLKAERDGWYVCIKDFYAGGKKQCSIGELVQAKGGMYMMGKEDISEWFRRAYYEEVRDAFGPNTDTNIPEQKPVEKQDYSGLNDLERAILRGFLCAGVENVPIGIIKDTAAECIVFLALIEPTWSEEEIEEMVNERATKSCTTKSEMAFYRNGIKDAIKRFDLRPPFKPSEEQMEALLWCVAHLGGADRRVLAELYEHLKKLM